ncbi:MAG: branched-chain amino acid ABC transporter permease [Actinomycetota bacterium]
MFTFQQGSSSHRGFVIGSWVLFAIGAVLLPYVLWEVFGLFQVGRLNRALYFAVAILGVNLVVGYSGLIALGHSAFVGIGAFLTIWLINDFGWDYWMTIPVAIAIGFLVGVLLGVPALRIKGLYLALLTIAFAAVFPSLMKLDKFGIADATGGANGRNIDEILVAPSWAQSLLGIDDTAEQQEIYQYFVILILTVLAFWATRNLLRSRPGRAIIAIRDNETGAAVSGVNLPLYKTLTFGVSAALGALAGVMWVMNIGFAGEQDFGFAPLAVPLLVGLVIGGVATIEGAVVGAFVVVFVREYTKSFGLDILSESLFGLILIAVTFFAPGGVVGFAKQMKGRIMRTIPRPPEGAVVGRAASPEPPAEEVVPEPAV